jgi:hypothetical protein
MFPRRSPTPFAHSLAPKILTDTMCGTTAGGSGQESSDPAISNTLKIQIVDTKIVHPIFVVRLCIAFPMIAGGVTWHFSPVGYALK